MQDKSIAERMRELGRELEEKTSQLIVANRRLWEIKRELSRKVRRKTKVLSFLYTIERDISNKLELKEVLRLAGERICAILGVKICSILLLDEKTKKLRIEYARGLEESIVVGGEVGVEGTISGWVATNNKPIFVKNIEKDSRFAKISDEKYYNKSFISVPLATKDRVIGVVNVNNKKSRKTFTWEDFGLLKQVATQLAVVIENARLYKNLKDLYMLTIITLAEAIDARDHYTRRHSDMVAKYSVAIAKALKLPPERIELIRQAAHLHDIGKIAIHDSILLKHGKLSEHEWKEIMKHSERGAEILRPLVVFLNGVIDMVRHHHERYDGSGYPDGYRNGQIDIGARIMAVADAFDAMLSERPYRRAYSIEKAIEELKQNSGTQFDPQVVETFVEVIKRDPSLVEQRLVY